jgi:Leucine-rich repeat (LRR) protein
MINSIQSIACFLFRNVGEVIIDFLADEFDSLKFDRTIQEFQRLQSDKNHHKISISLNLLLSHRSAPSAKFIDNMPLGLNFKLFRLNCENRHYSIKPKVNLNAKNMKCLNGLETLILNDMDLKEFRPVDFFDCSKLTELNLENISLNRIESNMFDGLNSLQVLNLANNQIEKIESIQLTSLIHLNIRKNKIKELNGKVFAAGPTNLKTLDLSQNNIKRIDAKAFNGLTNLGDLDLSYNQLESLQSDTFFDLVELKRLNLMRNSFKVDKNFDKYLKFQTNNEYFDFITKHEIY